MKQLEKENLFLNTSLRRTLSRMRTSWYLLETDVRLVGKTSFQFFPYGEMQTDKKIPTYVEGDILGHAHSWRSATAYYARI